MKLGLIVLLLSVLVGVIPGATSWWTTESYWTLTTAYDSCWSNCGNEFSSCSCSSSCMYNGNCCYDYHDYCYQTTWETDFSTGGGSCGGFYTQQSGEFSSPNYPSNYPNYAHCSWRIQSTGTKIVDLTFTYVNVESHATCEYDGIRVYDGPSTSSRLMGTLCGSRTGTFVSSGNDLTVVFFSDRSGTGRGFVARWVLEEPSTPGPTNEYTSDSPSCRWNCGLNLGSCSCYSSCQYYGSCCHDYYDYCYTTTPYPDTPTAPPSCRWNCGYNLGSCSCSSSCQHYGSCCPDYSEYCGTTAYPSTLLPLPSCRRNCGYDLTECSCLGSCHYYGSCCPDYNDYCYTTTPLIDSTTEDFPSCRWNCGYDLGSCSCSSSCPYNGSCCHDYYDYCSVTGTPPENENATACGGNLTDSRGEFFSPQYPSNYPNNARCTWTLQASDRQVVNLIFMFVDLEPCCDSIRVYDGPTEAYPLLGNLPQDQRYRFNSTRNYLTVVFRSDHSVTRQGFWAEWEFSEMPSCRWSCGNSFSQCSCTSSCQYYGNCCHDYYTYCPTTTDMPTGTHPTCGGQLFESGTLSSPYYPNYYHDNAYCVWQLSAPAGQSIFLSFVDLELERCCGCDYINVYDGSSTASPLLGKLCYNDTTLRDFRSSSSYLTVLFRSDSSGVARGFKGSFSSSLTENTARVACSSDSMAIVIRRSYLDSLGISWQNLYVDDHRCRPSANSYDVSFNFPVNQCGTSKTTNNGRVVYNNHVRSAPSQSGEITRQIEQFLLSVHCHMEQDTTVGTVYKVNEIMNSSIAGTGRFNASIAFYPSPSFSYPILEFPYVVNLNQDLYVQVQLSRADNTLDLLVDSCVTSPNHDFQARSYTLIRNGCAQDGTTHIYTNGRQYYAQFSFKAFKFLRTHSYVFLQCRVIICADDDYNSRCRQGCRMRKKRSLDSSHHHTETVTLGPIARKGAESAAKAEIEE